MEDHASGGCAWGPKVDTVVALKNTAGHPAAHTSVRGPRKVRKGKPENGHR